MVPSNEGIMRLYIGDIENSKIFEYLSEMFNETRVVNIIHAW